MVQTSVGVIMGSESDWGVMSKAVDALHELGLMCEATIVSAHRTPDRLFEYCRSAEGRGLKVLIAGAGGAAHLPGMAASLTLLPVIGVPVAGRLAGLDSLLSIVQMPPGVPVATMAVDGARNAGIFAAKILALQDPALRLRLHQLTQEQEAKVLEQAQSWGQNGPQSDPK